MIGRSTSIPLTLVVLVALVVVVVLGGGCGREQRAKLPEGTNARIVLEANVEGRPELVREVWSNRFQAAVETGFLPVVTARAEVAGNKLTLDTELVVAGGCTQAGADALAERVKDIATRSGRLGIFRVRAEDAEMLSRQLRDALPEPARVSTPHDLPGAIVVRNKSFDEVYKVAKDMLPPGLALLREPDFDLPEGKVHLDPPTPDTRMWVVEETPALDGRSVTRAFTEDNELGVPTVRVMLSESATRAFGDLTMEQLQKPLPIAFEDIVVAAPMVVGRIETGNIQISLPPSMRQQAQTIAAVLTSGGLREAPKVDKLEAKCLDAK
ncbi:MAG: hypothetical protein U1F43_08825 [Myxococcota bacterium]